MGKISARDARLKRKTRIRRHVVGTTDRPRMSVYRGNRHIYCQIIDDTRGITLASASSLSQELKAANASGFTIDLAREVGTLVAAKAREKGIDKVVFDKGGYKYHGKVKALADGARSGGLQF